MLILKPTRQAVSSSRLAAIQERLRGHGADEMICRICMGKGEHSQTQRHGRGRNKRLESVIVSCKRCGGTGFEQREEPMTHKDAN